MDSKGGMVGRMIDNLNLKIVEDTVLVSYWQKSKNVI